jgi:hypothetical protein
MRDAAREDTHLAIARPSARPLAVALLLGCALLGAGAAVHPVLSGDGARDLRLIAATGYWRALHLSMLAGSGLILAGIWVRLLDAPPAAPGRPVPATTPLLLAALAIVSIGLAINALNIGFMAGAGTHMAAMFRAGRTEMAPLFEATHPVGLIAARIGNFIVALGALVLGWAEHHEARLDPSRPRWLAWLAWGAGLAGLIGAIVFDEASRLALAAVALLSAWEIATAFRALRAPIAPARPVTPSAVEGLGVRG